jgi:F-type H+-transporting ATPase subunit c
MIMDAASAKLIGAGLAVIGMGIVGLGLGFIFSAWLQALGRNPTAAPVLRQMGFLGFALTEALALFAFVLAIVILLNVL